MSRAEKEVIAYVDLLSRVQAVFAQKSECRNIHINGLSVFEDEVDGANWDIERYRLSGGENDWPTCCEAVQDEIRRLRERYKVENS